jgi:surface protein
MQPITDKNIRMLVSIYCSKSRGYEELGDISEWDVSNVTDMSSLFLNNTSFNQPLEKWNVSKVTNMSSMFLFAMAFNQPLNEWDVECVTYCP